MQITKYIGLGSSGLTLVGCLLKTLLLPGASAILLLGIALFCIGFIPLRVVEIIKGEESYRFSNWIQVVGLIMIGMCVAGMTFKLMHWPWVTFLMRSSTTMLVFVILPIHLVATFFKTDANGNDSNHRASQIHAAVIAMALFGALYGLV